MKAGTNRKREEFGIKGTFKAAIASKNGSGAVFEVWHVGKNDYRVILLGAGEYSQHHQLNPAVAKAWWLCDLQAADLAHELTKIAGGAK